MITVEEGKFYITAGGEIFGPMIRTDNPSFPWKANYRDKDGTETYTFTFTANGLHLKVCESSFDLVKEVKPAICIKKGKYYLTKSDIVIGPMMRNDHPYFPWRAMYNGSIRTYMADGSHLRDCKCELDLVEEIKPTLCIEEGKYYVARNGQIIGPMARREATLYPWRGRCGDTQYTFCADGRYHAQGSTGLDLVEEIKPIACKVTKSMINIEEGKYYVARNGQMIGPMKRRNSKSFPWSGRMVGGKTDFTYTPCGSFNASFNVCDMDLIAEKEFNTVSHIEVGKMYQMRCGRVIGPITENINNTLYPFMGREYNSTNVFSFTPQGQHDIKKQESEYDIMFEVKMKVEISIVKVIAPYEETCYWVVYADETAKLSGTGTITETKMTRTEAENCFCEVVCKFQHTKVHPTYEV